MGSNDPIYLRGLTHASEPFFLKQEQAKAYDFIVPLTTGMVAFRVVWPGMANFGTNILLTVLPSLTSTLAALHWMGPFKSLVTSNIRGWSSPLAQPALTLIFWSSALDKATSEISSMLNGFQAKALIDSIRPMTNRMPSRKWMLISFLNSTHEI